MNQRTLMSIAAVPVFLASAVARAQAPAAPTADAPPAAPAAAPAAAPEPPPPPPPPPAVPHVGAVNKFQTTLYGWAHLDGIYDTTQALAEGSGNGPLPRLPAMGDFGPAKNGRTQMFAYNTRLGIKVNAPDVDGIKTSAQIEYDFFGNAGTTESSFTQRNIRLRHAFLRIESDAIGVLAGQTWDVFGGAVVPWLGAGMAFHGILGEIFHRNPQLRVYKVIKSDAVNFEVRAAAVRPAQREAQIPDLQGALRVTLNNWKTVHSFGSGLPAIDGLTVEVSGLYRFFKLNDFAAAPASYVKKNGWGVAADLWLPIIPATLKDQSNALGVSVQYATGAGIGDMFGANGGAAGFPNVTDANAMAMPPTTAVAYTPNIDPGIVTYNRATGQFFLPKWQGIVVGLQYRPPFEDGRWVVSSNHSYISSSNIADLSTPMGGTPTGIAAGGLWKSGLRNDLSISYTMYPAVVIGVMYETMQTTYVNVGPDGTDKSARNHRIQAALYFYF